MVGHPWLKVSSVEGDIAFWHLMQHGPDPEQIGETVILGDGWWPGAYSGGVQL